MNKIKFNSPVQIPDLAVDNIVIKGAGIESILENVVTPQNTITLRDGASVALLDTEYTGIVAEKYDGTNNGMLVFDNAGTAYVGDEGDLQPLATRDLHNHGSLVMWDANKNTLVEATLGEGFEASTISADKVILKDGITITNNFGNYRPNGTPTTYCEGESILTFLTNAFTSRIYPTTTNPAISSLSRGSTPSSVEEGSTVTPYYSISMNSYGYSDGTVSTITPTYSVTCTGITDPLTTQSGTFSSIVADSSITVTATASWGNDTAVPKDNMGEEYTAGSIKAGSDTESYTISTYKGCFYCTRSSKIDTLDSAAVRALASGTDGKHTTSNTPPSNITLNNDWTYFYIAVPGTSYSALSLFDVTGNRNIGTCTKAGTVEVNNAGTGKNNYTVFYFENLKPYQATTIKLTWS